MAGGLRVLVVEDDRNDFEMLQRELRRSFPLDRCERVEDPAALHAALGRGWDIVLSDGHLPAFSWLEALEIVRGHDAAMPFILCTGTIGEDSAVDALKAGVDDYVLKNALNRLAPALEVALRTANVRREHARTQEEMQRFRLALDNSADMVVIIDRQTMRHVDVNQTMCRLLGYSRDELLRMGPADILPVGIDDLGTAYDELIADPARQGGMRSHYVCKDGSRLPFESTRHVLRSGERWMIAAISRDIRERIAAEQALQESEAGLRRAQTMARLAHVITRKDGSFESWSDTLPGLAGLEAARLPDTTRGWIDLLNPADRGLFRATAIEAGMSGSHAEVEYRLQRPDGELVQIRQTMEPLDGARWFSTLQDVTHQKRAEERVRRLNRVYAVLSGINGLIVRATDRDELFREACRIAVEAGGFRMAWLGLVDRGARRIEVVASNGADDAYLVAMPLSLTDTDHAGPGLAGRAVEHKTAVSIPDMARDARILLRTQAAERGYRALAILPLLVGDEAVGVLALYAAEAEFFDAEEIRLLEELAGDIAFALEHIRKQERLDYLAYYDPLTGLANAALFRERLAQYVATAQREQHRLALILVNIERFKTINDAFGRQSGDVLLRAFGERLSRLAGDPKHLARVGSDHFAVVMPHVKDDADLAGRIEHSRRGVDDEPYRTNAAELRISTRAGIALFPGDGPDADTLFRNAESALKTAKDTGERYVFYAREMSERVAEKLALENKLRLALERDEFILHYQPKVDLATGSIVGVEALIRWRNPEAGMVPPGQFVPLLEETGLILEVGSWALARAAKDHQAWARAGLEAPRVAVNVSAIQLRQREFVAMVEHAIMEGLAPIGIDLEITESLIMRDVEATIGKLQAVRGLGMKIAIDDFGTGYSSLAYLARLPVQSLKIDRAFIVGMLDDPNTATLVQTIISLAHSLRMEVVAEGVESEEQAKLLRLLRCDQMQGFLFSKPLPFSEVSALLRKRA